MGFASILFFNKKRNLKPMIWNMNMAVGKTRGGVKGAQLKPYWILPSLLLATFLLLLSPLAQGGVREGDDARSSRGRETDWGQPKKLNRPYLEDTFNFSFLVCGDPQPGLDTVSQCQTDNGNKVKRKMERIRQCVKKMNEVDDGCIGIIADGDLTQHTCNQEVIAFRQMFENDYPGVDGGDVWCGGWSNHDTYSKGCRINKPVYVGLGNHDDATEVHEKCNDNSYCHTRSDKVCHSDFVLNYVRARMYGSDALYQDLTNPTIENWHENEDHGSVYVWEWGNIHFIMGNLWVNYNHWAASSRCGGEPCDKSWFTCKLDWLRDHLKTVVGDSGKAVVLIQHYGWGDFDEGWWCHDDADSVVNLLKPYNVIGIFTAHMHLFTYHKVYTSSDKTRWFDNYVVDDVGPGDFCDADKYYDDFDDKPDDCVGFFKVNIEYAPGENADGPLKMTIDKIHGYFWEDDDKHPYQWRTEKGAFVKYFSTSFTDWDQGEPNNVGGCENCAAFHSNGRFRDVDCTREEYVACAEGDGDQRKWHILTDKKRTWQEGFQACKDKGWGFDLPRDLGKTASVRFAQQVALKKAVNDANLANVWINYTDKFKEGDWHVAKEFEFYWDDDQPDNGHFGEGTNPDSPVYGKLTADENCAVLGTDGLMQDVRCVGDLHYFACKKEGTSGELVEWKLARFPGMWKEGEAECKKLNRDNDSYEFKGPDGDQAAAELKALIHKIDESDLTEKEKTVWIGLNDLNEEGSWGNEAPWYGWAEGEPNNNDGMEHCTELRANDHKWNDTSCDREGYGFACRNYVTGEWKVGIWPDSDVDHVGKWDEGFDYCHSVGPEYRFDVPVSEKDNEAIVAQMDKTNVWLNFTDNPNGAGLFAGLYRPVHWENWAPGEPNNDHGDENCAEVVLYAGERGMWNDINCSDEKFALCNSYYKEGDEYELEWHTVYWDTTAADADAACHKHLGPWWWFAVPDCNATTQELLYKQVLNQYILINYSDADFEGNWLER